MAENGKKIDDTTIPFINNLAGSERLALSNGGVDAKTDIDQISDYVVENIDLDGKMDKVPAAAEGSNAVFDANGQVIAGNGGDVTSLLALDDVFINDYTGKAGQKLLVTDNELGIDSFPDPEPIIATKGVGLLSARPSTGLTVGGVYVGTDTNKKYTYNGAGWDIEDLIESQFITDTSSVNIKTYQYVSGSVQPSFQGTSAVALGWDFDDATALVDPTSGFLNLDNSDLSLVTEARFSNIAGHPLSDVATMLLNSDGKFVLIVQEDNADKFLAITVTEVIDETTYKRFTITVEDSGDIFDDGATLLTSFISGVSSSGSGGHTIQENGVSFPQQAALDFITGNGESVATDNPTNGSTELSLKLRALVDYFATGEQIGDVVEVISGGFAPGATAPDTSLLKSSEVINATGQINYTLTHGSEIDSILAYQETGSSITLSLGSVASGTDIVNAASIPSGVWTKLTIGTGYFSGVNDQSVFATISSGSLTAYFLTKEVQ